MDEVRCTAGRVVTEDTEDMDYEDMEYDDVLLILLLLLTPLILRHVFILFRKAILFKHPSLTLCLAEEKTI